MADSTGPQDAVSTTPEPSLGIQNQVSDLPDVKAVPDLATPGGNAITRFFKSHPTGFWFFFWGEFAERCSYYGMRAILSLYMAEQLGLGEKNAATYMSFFIAACYFLPLVGGYVADNFFGKYWTIVGFSLPYIAGQVIIGFESPIYLVIALALLAMGSGVIKPNISTLMGLTYDQQRPGQEKLRTDAFSIFYFSINVGAAIASFSLPWIRTTYSYQIAFLFPAVLMLLAFIVFAAGKPYYAKEVINREAKPLDVQVSQWQVLKNIFGLFVLVMFFWAIFDQASSTWIFFANLYMDCRLFGPDSRPVPPDMIQTFNPVFIMILLPLVMMFWKWLDRRGVRVRATDKMVGGFLLTAVCMGIIALSAMLVSGPVQTWTVLSDAGGPAPTASAVFVLRDGSEVPFKQGEQLDKLKKEKDKDKQIKEIKLTPADGKPFTVDRPVEKKTETVEGKEVTEYVVEWVAPEHRVTVWWQILAYLVITIAEILISVTGLELAYTAAPKAMTGFVTACWLLTVGMANLFINAPVTRLYKALPPATYFGMLAVTMLVVTGAFFLVARRFNRVAAAAPAGAGAPLTPPAAPSDKITDRDRYQNPS